MTHAEFTKRWFDEVWNNQNADAIDEMFAEDGVANGIANDDGSPVVGPKDYKPFHQKFVNAFPDLKVTVEDSITEGDKIAVRCRVNATHCGEGIGVTPLQHARRIHLHEHRPPRKRQDRRSLEQHRFYVDVSAGRCAKIGVDLIPAGQPQKI